MTTSKPMSFRQKLGLAAILIVGLPMAFTSIYLTLTFLTNPLHFLWIVQWVLK